MLTGLGLVACLVACASSDYHLIGEFSYREYVEQRRGDAQTTLTRRDFSMLLHQIQKDSLLMEGRQMLDLEYAMVIPPIPEKSNRNFASVVLLADGDHKEYSRQVAVLYERTLDGWEKVTESWSINGIPIRDMSYSCGEDILSFILEQEDLIKSRSILFIDFVGEFTGEDRKERFQRYRVTLSHVRPGEAEEIPSSRMNLFVYIRRECGIFEVESVGHGMGFY